jgi:hypothetical protein
VIVRALLALVAAGLVVAPAAEAGVRADAKRLAQLNLEDYRASKKPIQAILTEYLEELETCRSVPPESVGQEAENRWVSLFLRGAISRTDAMGAKSIQRLRAFRTSDRRLQRVARAMVHSSELLRELGEAPPALCPYMDAWKAAGWAKGFRIAPPVRNFTAQEVTSLRRDARTVRDELGRMRRLGVSRAALKVLRDGYTAGELYGRLAL